MIVGVLAIQGGFKEHLKVFEGLGVNAVMVRNAAELAVCDAIVVPGGESTVLKKHVFPELTAWIQAKKPYMGTCAGAILFAECNPGLLSVERNAYGNQQASFIQSLSFNGEELPGVFIRAPKLSSAKGVVLATVADDIVGLSFGAQVVYAFHPELTGSDLVHRHFIDLVKGDMS